jgi:hypothetical protein
LLLVSILLNCNPTSPSVPGNDTKYNLTIIAGTGGKITSQVQQTIPVKEGTTISLAASADPGFSFARWRVLGDNANLSYANVSHTKVTTANCDDTVVAEFISVPALPSPLNLSTIPTENGANFLIFKGSLPALTDIDNIKPDSVGATDSLSVITFAGSSTGFGVVLNSYLSIPLDGNYHFYLGSSGRSTLYLNDSAVLTNNGMQPTSPQDSVIVHLLQGTYLIELRYYAATSTPYFSVSYSCPDIGIEKMTIPADALQRCDTRPVVKLIVNKPAGGETFHPGDTIHIQWTYKNPRGQIFAQLSVNNGKSYFNICNEAFPGTVSAYNWVVPVNADTLNSSTVLVRVKEYPPYNVSGVSKKFSISGSLP